MPVAEEIKEIKSITDLEQDDRNANQHTVRGQYMVVESIRRCGYGRSVLADKNGKLIAGNLTTECAGEVEPEDIIVVRTDGKQLVVVQRTDLDLSTDTVARQLAYADNRSHEVSQKWNADLLIEDKQTHDLSWLFFEGEVDQIADDASEDDGKEREQTEFVLTVTCSSSDELAQAAREIAALGYNVR